MSTPPDNSKLPSPQLRAEYIQMFENLNLHSERKESQVIFIPARDPLGGEDPSQLVATFDVSDNLALNELLNATLVFQANVPGNEIQDVHVQVYEKNEDRSLGELVTTQVFSMAGKQRISIRLPTDAVTKWYTTSPISGIFVSAMVNGYNVAVHPQQTSDDFENMILQLSIVRAGRPRRNAVPVCTKENPSTGCCLYDLMIDFEKIGWGWIIAPTSYNAYMCRGSCQFNEHHFVSGHTKIMRVAHRMGQEVKELVGNAGFCCHPSEYDFMQLVYVNKEGVVTTARVNGMVARRCACS
uniref:TGF_BETA_2 domain-containing protein n=1 Tax=Caenorhabditis japonica TaxID=281687 RepID=A0A8R1HVA6_CAEJA